MVNRRYLQNKKLLGRRRLSCISFDPMGAWLQRILPPRTTSYLLYLKYIVFTEGNFLVEVLGSLDGITSTSYFLVLRRFFH